MTKASLFFIGLTLMSSLTISQAHAADDPYLWLEEIESTKSLDWVKAKNEVTRQKIEEDKTYPKYVEQAEAILNAKDKLRDGPLYNGYVYNFWQDETNVRGIWRRCHLKSFTKGTPKWEILIDFDQLAKTENENWVYKGAECLSPDYRRCMIRLSRGGKDASVLREFDVPSRSFVKESEQPFVLPELKSYVEWIDLNTLLLNSPFSDSVKTEAGYAREARIWRRGEKFDKSTVVYTAPKSDTGVWGGAFESQGRQVVIISRAINSLEQEFFLLSSDLKKTTQLSLPKKGEVHGFFKGMLLATSSEDWSIDKVEGGKQNIPAGDLVAFDLDAFVNNGKVPVVHTLFSANPKTSFEQVSVSKNHVYVNYLENVKSRLVRKTWNGKTWKDLRIKIKDQGSTYVRNTTPHSDDLLLTNTDLLTPTQIVYIDAKGSAKVVAKLPPRFKSAGLITEQRFATSKDGTKVPFFVVRNRKIKFNGKNPTLLYAYGGFSAAMTPSYRAISGKLWLEPGGVYVLANIRGGSEFGPSWHLGAVKEKRIKAYEDFIAVAEELIKLKITSTPKLAIQGGSNGGLLVSATMVMRPDLFGAVVSEVPLTDMLRFQKLLAGASWTGEYGNPDLDEGIRKFWEGISPYQNLKKDVKYPPILFATSTKDDRVHPGHARKMAARMLELGQDVTYFENIEGGHSASANLLQLARHQAIVYTFLKQRLF